MTEQATTSADKRPLAFVVGCSYRVGQMLYSASVNDDTGRVQFETYIVRSIRNGKVHAVQRIKGITIVSAGWNTGRERWASSIPAWCRRSCRIGDRFDRLHRTKSGARAVAKKSHERWLRRAADRAASNT